MFVFWSHQTPRAPGPNGEVPIAGGLPPPPTPGGFRKANGWTPPRFAMVGWGWGDSVFQASASLTATRVSSLLCYRSIYVWLTVIQKPSQGSHPFPQSATDKRKGANKDEEARLNNIRTNHTKRYLVRVLEKPCRKAPGPTPREPTRGLIPPPFPPPPLSS